MEELEKELELERLQEEREKIEERLREEVVEEYMNTPIENKENEIIQTYLDRYDDYIMNDTVIEMYKRVRQDVGDLYEREKVNIKEMIDEELFKI